MPGEKGKRRLGRKRLAYKCRQIVCHSSKLLSSRGGEHEPSALAASTPHFDMMLFSIVLHLRSYPWFLDETSRADRPLLHSDARTGRQRAPLTCSVRAFRTPRPPTRSLNSGFRRRRNPRDAHQVRFDTFNRRAPCPQHVLCQVQGRVQLRPIYEAVATRLHAWG